MILANFAMFDFVEQISVIKFCLCENSPAEKFRIKKTDNMLMAWNPETTISQLLNHNSRKSRNWSTKSSIGNRRSCWYSGSARTILKDHFGLKTVSSRFAPNILDFSKPFSSSLVIIQKFNVFFNQCM